LHTSMRGLLLVPILASAMAGGMAGKAVAQAAAPSEIVGVWETEDGNLKFEMFDAGGTYAARMIYGALLVEADGKTFKRDTLNPDPKLRNRSLEGIVFLTDLKWDAGDGRWENGSFYQAPTGRTLSAQVTLVSGKMELRPYMGTPMLGRTLVLRRATPAAQARSKR
jgi:uncharacterized protein (DUF2147 family)